MKASIFFSLVIPDIPTVIPSEPLRATRDLCPILVIFFLVGLCSFFIPTPLRAAEIITTAPAVFDFKAKARDILPEKIILTNKSDVKLNIYTFVNNVLAATGEAKFLDPVAADHSSSLANWILISRGVLELAPGEKKAIDFSVEVNMRAKPGIYHAIISFAAGATRAEAEANLNGAAKININLEVLDNAKEIMEIKKFMPDKNIFSKFPVSFSYTLANSGDRSLLPTGRILIYNRRGEEVSVIVINPKAANIEPQTSKNFQAVWPDGKDFGKYKALLNIEYGNGQRKTLHDVIFFWVIPWQKLLIIFGGAGMLLTIFVFWQQKKRYAATSIIILLMVLFGYPISKAHAFEKLTLTITPPLFQMAIGPGEVWRSSLKIVNTNPYDLTVYAGTMNFEAGGEEGQGRFVPILESDASSFSLAKWIEITPDPIFIPQGKSVDIPFTVRIPPEAEAGGHYAAILVGTRPQNENQNGANILVSSQVSSLFLVRINGDVREEGYIQEFKTDRKFYEKPDIDFILRFANTGNVHLKPQGEIAIFNLWGREMGKIMINEKSDFGNVLPRSARKFIFNWQRDFNILEAGRFKAVAVISYGEDARQNVSHVVYFWVLPGKPLLVTLISFLTFVLIIIFLIRRYVKRSLASLEQRIIFANQPRAKKK